MDTKKKLESLYFDPSNPLGLGSAENLYQAAKLEGLDVTHKDVTEFLSGQEAYTLVKKRPKANFRKVRYIVSDMYDIFQSDLADMQSLARYNDGFKYIMVIINCFSKFCWAIPLKNKESATLARGLKGVLDSIHPNKPRNFIVDRAKEHYAKPFVDEIRGRGIQLFYTTNDESHAVFAERKIRDLKRKLFIYMKKRNTWRYIDVLQDIVDGLNGRIVRTTGFRPIDVNENNEDEVRRNLYPQHYTTKPPVYKFDVGDRVKLLKRKFPFAKAFYPIWTDEEFFISDRIQTEPPTYRIKSITGEPILGLFYEQEMQRVTRDDDVYEIDKILERRRGKGGKTKYLVSWKGYPTDQASWVDEGDIKRLT